MHCLSPLVAQMRGHHEAESLTTRVFGADFDVAALAQYVERCVSERAFPLGVSDHLHGRHVGANYKSAVAERTRVTEAIAKRLTRKQTVGPFFCDAESIPLRDFAINSLGAVPKKGTSALSASRR